MVVMVDKSTGTIQNVHTENRHLEYHTVKGRKGLVRVILAKMASDFEGAKSFLLSCYFLEI